jgi:hypothetical protein
MPFVTPFTYRDGATFLERFQDLRNYINKDVVPFVNKNTGELAVVFEEQVNLLVAQVNAALADQTVDVDQKITDLTAYVDAAVQAVIDDSVEVQDPVVASLINDEDSDTHTALLAFLTGFATEDQVNDILDIITTGRLSEAELDERYLGDSMDWRGAWLTATAYVVDDAVSSYGSSYIAKSAHTSGATTQPGIGSSWATVWDLLAAKGDPGDAAGGNDVANVRKHFAPKALAAPLTGSLKTGNVAKGTKVKQIINDTLYNAFPSMALTQSGVLVAVWRQATHHDVAYPGSIYQSRSYDFGETWETPFAIKTDVTLDLRDPGITTLRDGRLLLHYRTAGASFVDHKVYMSYSNDDGETWGGAINIPFTFNNYLRANDNIIELEDGTLLTTAYGKNTGQTYLSVRMVSTSDDGLTWSSESTVANGNTDSKDYNETQLGVLPNGDIRALVRNETGTKTILRTTSSNNGLTWGALSTVVVGSGRPTWIRLKSGAHILIYRRNSDYSFEYVTSWDEGITWTAPDIFQDVLTGGSASAYASPVELAPGLIGVAYSDETTPNTKAYVRFKYLADGIGITPIGDFFKGSTSDSTGLTEVFIPATEFLASTASPTLGVLNGYTPAWLMDQATIEAVASTVKVPPTWLTYNVTLIWAPFNNLTSANVFWRVITNDVIAGAVVGGGNEQADATVAAPATAYQVVSTVVQSGQAKRSNIINLRVQRVANNAGDTYTGDAGIIGVLLTKAS